MSRHILSHSIPHGEHVLIGPLGKLGSALLWIHVLVPVFVARVVPRLLKRDAERVVKKSVGSCCSKEQARYHILAVRQHVDRLSAIHLSVDLSRSARTINRLGAAPMKENG
jgi:hypothetical protein